MKSIKGNLMARRYSSSIALIFAFLALSLLPLAQVAHAQDGSITTIFASNNAFAGNMFDVTAQKTLTITAFDVNLTTGTDDVYVYYKPGTYVGFTDSSAAWTLLGTDNVNSLGSDLHTRANIGGLTIHAGETYALYVSVAYNGVSMRYTNGNQVYSNADITLTLGIGKGSPAFTGSTFSLRTWNGTIYYTLGETGGEAPLPGCTLPVPEGSVVGDTPYNAQVYYEPGNVSPGIFLNPGTYIVTGQDTSETYYQIVLACQFLWVPKDVMQPSYLPPQNGTPLPTRIVGDSVTTPDSGPLDSDAG